MAPSLTETLFALGLGDRLVGVTRYCGFPAEARALPAVGGHLDPSYEAIVALEPDLVLLHRAHGEAERRLRSLDIRSARVDQDRVDAVLRSFREIAAACGVPERGAGLRARVEAELDAARVPPERDPPRILVVVNRTVGVAVRTVWAAGRGSYHDDLLRLAGAVNVLGDTVVAHPELSREGLLALDPDVVLDLVADLDERGVDRQAAIRDWADLRILRAVRAGRIHMLDDDALFVPGPRVADAVRAFATAIHRGEDGEPPP